MGLYARLYFGLDSFYGSQSTRQDVGDVSSPKLNRDIWYMKNPYWHPDEKNHVVDPYEVLELAVDVFNIVRSSMSMQSDGADKDIDEDYEPTPIEQAHYDWAESQLSRKLLRISVLLRTLDDYLSDRRHKDYIKLVSQLNKESNFGTLDIKKKSTDLKFREVLNKIIHAADIRPVYETEDASDDKQARWGMDGQLELTGKYRKDKWIAVVYLVPFLDSVVELMDAVEVEQL